MSAKLLANLTGVSELRIAYAIDKAGSVRTLLQQSEDDLVVVYRLTRTAARRLRAAGELYRALDTDEIREVAEVLSRPEVMARHVIAQYWRQGQEIMGAVYLDTRLRAIGSVELFRGTLNRAAVEPGPILREGLKRCAASFVLFHTHPSGDPSPSAEDLSFTRRMAEAGEQVGVLLVDHLIVASPTRWASLRQRGGW